MHKWTKFFRWPRRSSEVDQNVSSSPVKTQLGSTVLRNDVLVCSLRISFNNEVLLSETNLATKLYGSDAFQALNNGAMQELGRKIELGTRTLFLKYGRCRLITPDAGEKFYPLRDQSQWCEAVRKIFPAAILEIHEDHPRLDVRLEYSAVQLAPINGQCYTETLRREIHRQMRMQTNFEERAYILLNEFIGLLSVACLQRLLQEDESFHGFVENDDLFVDRFAKDVSQNARKLLAICLFTGLPLLILKVMREQGLSDAHLPLRPEQCSGKLTTMDFNLLVSEQWAFLPHRFTKQEDIPQLVSECIVPMSFDPHLDQVGVGSYSYIYKVSIDQACHVFSTDEDALFALKHFDSCSIVAPPCQRELAMLNEISRFPNPHVVSHFAAWEQRNSLFILFPLAKGDLRWFMTKPKPTLDQEFVLWFLSQLRGLADAIHHLHNLDPGVLSNDSHQSELRENVLHLDLKPENILVFKRSKVNDDVFMISDFGSGKVKQQWTDETSSHSGSTQTAETALTYTGPDVFLNGKISRPYDMWSLGCILLELISWAHLGPEQGVEDFATARLQTRSHQSSRDDAFWQSRNDACEQVEDHSLVSLKPAVSQCLSHLESHCFAVFSPVLSSIRKLLRINPAERLNAEGLLSELQAVYEQAQSRLDLDSDST